MRAQMSLSADGVVEKTVGMILPDGRAQVPVKDDAKHIHNE